MSTEQPFEDHDVKAQTMTGVCCRCQEVACDDDCAMGVVRMSGDSLEFRNVVINRTSGEIHMLQRSTGIPFPKSIGILTFKAAHHDI